MRRFSTPRSAPSSKRSRPTSSVPKASCCRSRRSTSRSTFQRHHKEHAEVLAKTVEKLGGKPVMAKVKYNFPVDQLKSQADVLGFAAKLEQGAVSAYLGAVPLFGNRDLAKAAASILGDEAMHWAVLRQALGQAPVPSAFVS